MVAVEVEGPNLNPVCSQQDLLVGLNGDVREGKG